MAERHRADRSAELDPAILLVDMDSFFASVEVRDDPSLRGKPVLVGGDGGRGVVASCTYEARRFGIRSAMPMSTAKRLCPDAVVLGGRMDRYAQVSRQLREILLDHSPLVEPLGLDEAFVDVTGAVHLLGTPLEIARSIESRVREDLRLRCGIGVGPSKLIAKLASRDAKPSIIDGRVIEGPGVFVVLRDEVQDYLDQFPVRALYGVGPATAKTLARLGIERVSELARLDPDVLTNHVGHHYAHTLIGLARGAPGRGQPGVQVDRERGDLLERCHRSSAARAAAAESGGGRLISPAGRAASWPHGDGQGEVRRLQVGHPIAHHGQRHR
jgi:DNA polymerase-4